jgi:hypothetical protein
MMRYTPACYCRVSELLRGNERRSNLCQAKVRAGNTSNLRATPSWKVSGLALASTPRLLYTIQYSFSRIHTAIR